ncbi:hypothetical protein [Lusitaniella coriacea]|uniref:hypothetical protein n=1 Tax=Lusitaniella coriacea TaxID=1983105 RepID=UPI003CEE9431
MILLQKMPFIFETLTQSKENIPLGVHFDLSVVVLLMVIELVVGVLFGLISKEAAKLKARNFSDNRKIFRVEEYNSQNNENRIPQKAFIIYGMDYSLVIAEYSRKLVIRECFYTPLGDCTKVEYKEDGTWKSSSSVSVPTYTSTVVFPILGGCALCVVVISLLDESFSNAREIALLLGNFGVDLLVSGVLWFAGTFWLLQMLLVAIAKKKINSEKSENLDRIENRGDFTIENELQTGEMQNNETNGIERFFWVFLIFGTTCIALFWYIHSFEYTAQNPELKSGYYTLILSFLFWANIPWAIIGIGCLTSNSTFQDYLEPKSFHPYLIAFFASLLLIFTIGSYWIFVAGGAEMLVNYPGLFVSNAGEVLDSQTLNPKLIKSWWCLGVASGVATMAFVLIKILRSSLDPNSKRSEL